MPAHPSFLAPELWRRLAQRRGDEGKGVRDRQALRSVCPSGRAQGWGGGTPQQSSLVLLCLRRRVFFPSYSCRCGFKSPVTFKCSAPAPAQGTETASWKLNWLQQRGQSPFPHPAPETTGSSISTYFQGGHQGQRGLSGAVKTLLCDAGWILTAWTINHHSDQSKEASFLFTPK